MSNKHDKHSLQVYTIIIVMIVGKAWFVLFCKVYFWHVYLVAVNRYLSILFWWCLGMISFFSPIYVQNVVFRVIFRNAETSGL